MFSYNNTGIAMLPAPIILSNGSLIVGYDSRGNIATMQPQFNFGINQMPQQNYKVRCQYNSNINKETYKVTPISSHPISSHPISSQPIYEDSSNVTSEEEKREQEIIINSYIEKIKQKYDAKLKVEQDAKLKAEQDAKLKADQDAKLKAEQDAKLKAEAKFKAELEKSKIEKLDVNYENQQLKTYIDELSNKLKKMQQSKSKKTKKVKRIDLLKKIIDSMSYDDSDNDSDTNSDTNSDDEFF
jgi:hypothetical protein